jgi:hypothetical protein
MNKLMLLFSYLDHERLHHQDEQRHEQHHRHIA